MSEAQELVDRMTDMGTEAFVGLSDYLNRGTVETISGYQEAAFQKNAEFITAGIPVNERSPLRGRRVLLWGAGPSGLITEEQAAVLNGRSEDVVIVACDRAFCGYPTIKGRVRGLAERGLRVDIVFGVDPISGTGDNTIYPPRGAVLCPPKESIPGSPTLWAYVMYDNNAVRSFVEAGIPIKWFMQRDEKWKERIKAVKVSQEVEPDFCRRMVERAQAAIETGKWTDELGVSEDMTRERAEALREHFLPGTRGEKVTIKILPCVDFDISGTMAMLLRAVEDGAREIAFIGYDLCEPRYAVPVEELERRWTEARARYEARYPGLPDGEDFARRSVHRFLENKWGVPLRRWLVPSMPPMGDEPEDALVLPEKMEDLGEDWHLRAITSVTGKKALAPTRMDLKAQQEMMTRILIRNWQKKKALGEKPPVYVQCAPEGCLGYDTNGDLVTELFREETVESFATREA